MSDSDVDAGSGLENGKTRSEYRESAQGYTDGESSDAAPYGLGLEAETEEGEGWDETIRPPESRAEAESEELVGSILGAEELGLLSSEVDLGLGLPSTLGDQQLDLEALSSLLDMLETQANADGGVDAGINSNAAIASSDASALDFSWLDSLGSGDGALAGLGQGGTGAGDAGLEMDFGAANFMEIDAFGVGNGDAAEPLDMAARTGEMTEAELAQILAAFGTG
jgi:hypothetical protein